ncbi:alpha/beta fold hydrolase [Streptomyces spectabilis]|uniref:Alpha/beta hydrolase n=1 Tax=Streptomyces spectabilis TaxID=68270 RepID=A0A5P2X5W1_STRST|nr:alpha/beta hydrolase [Streptomyces spectabilis]MBB5107715.1 pimeloyl-ACP methyl ester carboxylesterase [Streptomyces spectabilis]MCI3903154.1 alpha/beta hydrolase [Streptomyces spectabilis]QEV60393.1 alpha/beta hydrolase [Streptomyces spectabilis]GGV38219.1 hydrolase [Streptomyces spectabilis]
MSDTVNTVPTDEELARSLEGDFTSAHAEVNGVRLHYVAGGSGDPLVLLGGWPQTWWQFHKVMPALARRYRVIAVDLRGMGGSAKPESGYDKKTMAQDVYELVRHLGHGRVHIAGHDIGAMVAHAFAANHPEATRKLALLDVAHPDPTLRELTLLPAVDAGTDWETAPGIYLWWFAFNQVKGLPEQLLDGRSRLLVDWLFGYMLKDQSSIDERSRAVYAAAYATPDAVRAGNAWYQTFRQDIDDFETYDRVGAPVLALAGDRNHAYLSAILPGHAKDVRVERIPDSGHYLPEEQPEQVTAKLTDFFA